MTTEARKREIFAQPSAMKEVYVPEVDHVNGHNIVRGPDAWHLFYGSKGGSQNKYKSHATSDDLLTWTTHEPVLHVGGPTDSDGGEIGDCCIVEHEGRWYMVYTSRPPLPASRRLSLAVSDDLWHWTKMPGDGSPVLIPHSSWSG